jgi:uncharacterized membrane protein YphA (DoxX/SURF4 family)
MLLEGSFYFREPNPTLTVWFLGLSAVAAGTLLLVGFLTPFAGSILAAGVLSVVLSLLPVCSPNLFGSKTDLVFAMTMLATIIGVGPGRFSVDARVFGRREIIIPPAEFPPLR